MATLPKAPLPDPYGKVVPMKTSPREIWAKRFPTFGVLEQKWLMQAGITSLRQLRSMSATELLKALRGNKTAHRAILETLEELSLRKE